MTPQQLHDWREFEIALAAAARALTQAEGEGEIFVQLGGVKEIQVCNYAGPHGTEERLCVAAPDPGPDKVSDAELELQWGATRDPQYSPEECGISAAELSDGPATRMVTVLAAAHGVAPQDARVRSADETGSQIAAAHLAAWLSSS